PSLASTLSLHDALPILDVRISTTNPVVEKSSKPSGGLLLERSGGNAASSTSQPETAYQQLVQTDVQYHDASKANANSEAPEKNSDRKSTRLNSSHVSLS